MTVHTAAAGGDVVHGNNNGPSLDEEMERILRSAGIDSAPIDPSSEMALKAMITERRHRPPLPPPATLSSSTTRNISISSHVNTPAAPSASAFSNLDWDHRKIAARRTTNPPHHGGIRTGILKTPPPSSSSTGGPDGPMVVTSSSNKPNPSDVNGATASMLMEQLRAQTNLLLDLHLKMQLLTEKVDRLEGRSGLGGRNSSHTTLQQQHSPPQQSPPPHYQQQQQQQQVRLFWPTDVPAVGQRQNDDDDDDEPVVVPPPPPPRHEDGRVDRRGDAAVPLVQARGILVNNPVIAVVGFPIFLVYRLVRFEVQVWQALWRMGRRDIPRMEGGMMFQMIFVLLVLSARMSPNTEPRKFGTIVLLILVGFLYQAKAFPFLYRFFIKDNVPQRIWRGIDPDGGGGDGVDDDDEQGDAANGARPPGGGGARRGGDVRGGGLPPHQPRRMGRIGGGAGPPGGGPDHGPNEGDLDGNGWRHTFLMGGIAPRGRQQQQQQDPQDPQHNGGGGGGIVNTLVGIMWDILYLFGSFVLSIFPMWRPEAQPQQELIPHANDPTEGGIGNGPHPLDPAQQPNDGEQQIPIIRAPHNAMVPTDDDDDDVEEEEVEDDDDDDNGDDEDDDIYA